MRWIDSFIHEQNASMYMFDSQYNILCLDATVNMRHVRATGLKYLASCFETKINQTHRHRFHTFLSTVGGTTRVHEVVGITREQTVGGTTEVWVSFALTCNVCNTL